MPKQFGNTVYFVRVTEVIGGEPGETVFASDRSYRVFGHSLTDPSDTFEGQVSPHDVPEDVMVRLADVDSRGRVEDHAGEFFVWLYGETLPTTGCSGSGG